MIILIVDFDYICQFLSTFIFLELFVLRSIKIDLIQVELFLFFANLVHQFSFEPATAGELPSEDYAPGVTLLPKKFSARLIPRF